MSNGADDIIDQAIAWHLRLDDASVDSWHDFVAWLEADPAHNAAYDRIVMDDAILVPSLQSNLPANDDAPARPRWRLYAGGGAIAAALMAAVLLPQQIQSNSLYTVETPVGTSRRIALDDGTSIEMNGGTRLTLKHGDNRYAALDAGEAVFHVRHDADHPFELTSGGYAIRDLGTVFNVARDDAHLTVQVAEGAVLFEPNRQAVTLKPGMQLAVAQEAGRATVSHMAIETVGGWRRGVLSFKDTPAHVVLRSVERSSGMKIRFADGLAQRPFTGTIHVAGQDQNLVPRVAAMMDADWKREGKMWVLTPRSNEDR